MRPTELQFRNPKEKTPDARYPLVTSDGRRLNFDSILSKGNFTKSRRFVQYDSDAKKTGYMIGPGSYDVSQKSISRTKSKGSPIFKKYHANKDVSNNGYYYCGNQLVFEPSFVVRSKSKYNCRDYRVDSTQLPERPTTGKETYRNITASRKSPLSTRPTSARSPYLSKIMHV